MLDALAQDSIARRELVLAPAFVCSWTDGGLDAAWLHLGGELDMATAPQLEDALREPELQARLVVLDLRELEFIDAAGVRTIVNASVRARQAGRRLVLLRGLPNIHRMFTLAGSFSDIEIGYVTEPPVAAIAALRERELAV
jgi:anti-sigma B factor antagonist